MGKLLPGGRMWPIKQRQLTFHNVLGDFRVVRERAGGHQLPFREVRRHFFIFVIIIVVVVIRIVAVVVIVVVAFSFRALNSWAGNFLSHKERKTRRRQTSAGCFSKNLYQRVRGTCVEPAWTPADDIIFFLARDAAASRPSSSCTTQKFTRVFFSLQRLLVVQQSRSVSWIQRLTWSESTNFTFLVSFRGVFCRSGGSRG